MQRMNSLPLDILNLIVGQLSYIKDVCAARIVCRAWLQASRRITIIDWADGDNYVEKSGKTLDIIFPNLHCCRNRTVIYPDIISVPMRWIDVRLRFSESDNKIYKDDISDDISLLHSLLKANGPNININLGVVNITYDSLNVEEHMENVDVLLSSLITDYVDMTDGQRDIVIGCWIEGLPLDKMSKLHLSPDWKYGSDGRSWMEDMALQFAVKRPKLVTLSTRKEFFAFPPREGDYIEYGWAVNPKWMHESSDQL